MPTFSQVIAARDHLYPPALAEDWDAIGAVCGDLQAPVSRILFAVDPHPEVIEEAISVSADLIITHHPLLLTPVHDVSTRTTTGRTVHRLISHNIALFTAHTNADSAAEGVSDALARVLGVSDAVPLSSGATAEVGLGRIGRLETPVSLAEFADRVAAQLPLTAHGVRVAGDPVRLVTTVAVCGGSGDSFLTDAAAQHADVYVTADLKHHRTLDHLSDSDTAVIDVAHWASEWPWLAVVAQRLTTELNTQGDTVEALVSTIVTDPWTFHLSGGAEVKPDVRSSP